MIAAIREAGVEGPGPDRFLSPEIETVVELVSSGALLETLEKVTGELR